MAIHQYGQFSFSLHKINKNRGITGPTVNTGVGLSSGSFPDFTNLRVKGANYTEVLILHRTTRGKKFLAQKTPQQEHKETKSTGAKRRVGTKVIYRRKIIQKKKNPYSSSKCKTYVFRQNGWRWCRGRCSGAPVILS